MLNRKVHPYCHEHQEYNKRRQTDNEFTRFLAAVILAVLVLTASFITDIVIIHL
ncbi:MAG: hypothetical protein RQ982_00605 [Gammaproteobacteria bacterium]|nr:hypothetical protein [Gammaproteobacteria bacterium]